MAPKKDPAAAAVPDFGAFINEAREKKKNQTLAQQIFGNKGSGAGNRRASAPGTNKRPVLGGSLASRVGIQKRSTSSARSSPRPSAGNVNADWTHDLHTLNNPPSSSSARNLNPPRGPRSTLNKSIPASSQFNILSSSRPTNNNKSSISIRGTAPPSTGPFCVVAKNLAQGTTSADIESAMQPIGGVILSCVLIAERPKVICEVVFESKEGADNVVETFHGQNADGNILDVYHQKGPISSRHNLTSTSTTSSNLNTTATSNYNQNNRSTDYDRRGGGDRYNNNNNDRERNAPRRSRDELIGGSHGFEDKMDTDDNTDKRGGLYSDDLMARNARGNVSGCGGRDRGRGYR